MRRRSFGSGPACECLENLRSSVQFLDSHRIYAFFRLTSFLTRQICTFDADFLTIYRRFLIFSINIIPQGRAKVKIFTF